MSKGHLIIYSGPSGVGKGTVRALLDDEKLNIGYSISMTTRKPRQGEENGKDYWFVDRDEFLKAIENGDLLEYTQFVGNYYGTPKKQVDQMLQEGKNVILEIEVDGARQVMDRMPEALSIFLLPPSREELERRIRGRGTDPEEVIAKRLQQSIEEIAQKDSYRFQLVNEDPEETARQVESIILSGKTD